MIIPSMHFKFMELLYYLFYPETIWNLASKKMFLKIQTFPIFTFKSQIFQYSKSQDMFVF